MAKYLMFGIFLCLLAVIQVETSQMYFLSTAVYFNRLYLEDHRLEILPGNVTMNIIHNLARDQPSDPWWALTVEAKNRRSERYRTVYRAKPINLCRMFKTGNSQFYMGFVKDFLKRGGAPMKCPYKKTNFSWLGINGASMHMPPFLEGIYRVRILNFFQLDGKIDMASNDTVDWEVK